VSTLDLPTIEPFDGESVLAFLATRAIAGVEEVIGDTYRRTVALGHGGGVIAVTPGSAGVRCELELEDHEDAGEAAERCRRLFGLDADPGPVEAELGRDPLLGPLVRRRPGMRVPGAADGFEMAARAIVGQQVSVAGARTVLGRLAARYGEPLAETGAGLTHRFPAPAALAEADPAALPFPRTRANALLTVARLAASGQLRLDPGAEIAEARAALVAIPGIGPWTASYVAMRALGDPDAFLPGDVGIRNALERLGSPGCDGERWRPWRSYAVMHLWRSLGG
jgi:AraC family transcriptional regulator, regulatory protein of adaptative response / DNA-3-methyladenine glycosylase II